jgi:Cu+-exporting ATPase
MTTVSAEGALELPVEGMHCAACAARLGRSLRALEGVRAAEVVYATGRAQLETSVSTADLARVVEAAGFQVPSTTVALRAVDASTAARLAAALSDAPLPGVLEATSAAEVLRVRVAAGVLRRGDVVRWATTAGAHLSLLPEDPLDSPVARARAASAVRDRALRLRFFVTLPFSVAVMVLAMHAGDSTATRMAQLLLSLPVVVYAGAPFFAGAWAALRRGTSDMNTLIALGTSAAFGWSVSLTLAPGLVGQVYFESATAIFTFVLLGRWLEGRARTHAGDATTALMSLAPDHAVRVGGPLEPDARIELDAVEPGDRLRLRVGERVPVDALVLEGQVAVDESMLTGEPVPVNRGPGAAVTGGTQVVQGTAVVEARRVGRETVLARIVESMHHAQASRAPLQTLVDRVSAVFVPVVLGLGLLTFLLWWGLAGDLDAAVQHTIAVLIVACPCALGLATPITLVASTGAAARMGFLVRDLGALERARRVRTLVFDKTGTLTAGRPTLEAIHAAHSERADLILARAAAVERGSTHPLARAVVSEAERRGLGRPEVTEFSEALGSGATAWVGTSSDRARLRIGTPVYTEVEPDTFSVPRAAADARGATSLYVDDPENGPAMLVFHDPVRPEAAAVLARLRARGLGLVLLTGDAPEPAQHLAQTLGLDEVISRARPEAKAEHVRALAARGRSVAMVGDGANDAPALASADVGIAVGEGAAAALEAADFVLLRPGLDALPQLFELAERTLRILKQNLAWAFGYNVLALPLAAGALVPFGLPALSPALASALMAASSVSVVANALRVRSDSRRVRLDPGRN